VSRQAVWNIAKQAGIELAAGKGSLITPEARTQILVALKANPNAKAVAGQVGAMSR
jgi:hypothetical protein